MSDGEKARTSGEVSRPEQTLPTVNPAAEKSEHPKPTFHPAVYVRYDTPPPERWNGLTASVWIALSSSVILFNKHLLHYANFSKSAIPFCYEKN